MEIFLALMLGTLFGFVLHRIGASNPENIINMLRLKDLHLMKTILLAIAIASAVLFISLALGLINPSHISIKESYWGVLVGGMLLGAGWAIAGYCPGTGLVALGDGRKDAVPFIAGGLVGAFIYMLVFANLEGGGCCRSLPAAKAPWRQPPRSTRPCWAPSPAWWWLWPLPLSSWPWPFFYRTTKTRKTKPGGRKGATGFTSIHRFIKYQKEIAAAGAADQAPFTLKAQLPAMAAARRNLHL